MTSVISCDGRITFHRAILTLPEGASISPCESIDIYLDPSREPAYSIHPEGGWVSPTYARISELVAIGQEPDFIDHVKCKCHKSKDAQTNIQSLEKTGHTASCPRNPHKSQTTQLPQAHPVPVSTNGASQSAAYGSPALAAVLGPDFIKESVTPLPPPLVPAGGLDDAKLSALMYQLEGSKEGGDGGISFHQAVEEVGASLASSELSVIASQLYKSFQFSKCNGCGTWGRLREGSTRCMSCPR